MKTKTALLVLTVLSCLLFISGIFLLQKVILLQKQANKQIVQALNQNIFYPKIEKKVTLTEKFFQNLLFVIAKLYEKQGCTVSSKKDMLIVTCPLNLWKENIWILETLKELPVNISELCFGAECKGCKLIFRPHKKI